MSGEVAGMVEKTVVFDGLCRVTVCRQLSLNAVGQSVHSFLIAVRTCCIAILCTIVYMNMYSSVSPFHIE